MTERLAGPDDIDFLVDERLRFVEMEPDEDGYEEMKRHLRMYYKETIASGESITILMEENGRVAGMGTIFFYKSVPSKDNIRGINGYITSIFVEDDYRRLGIGSRVVSRLENMARERGCPGVMLRSTEMGRKLYRKLGFQDQENGMYYRF